MAGDDITSHHHQIGFQLHEKFDDLRQGLRLKKNAAVDVR
jgi:hypothetical protein